MKDKKKKQTGKELDGIWRSKDFIESVIESIVDPMLVIDGGYNILLANKALKKAFNVRDATLKRLKCYQILHHLERPCTMVCPGSYPCPLKEVLFTERSSKVIHVFHDISNKIIFMEIIASPIFNENHEVVWVVKSFHNITERKKEEERLEKLVLDLQVSLAATKESSSLLQICTSCKRICDDKGDWKRLEDYVKEYSPYFSQSSCPKCKKKR